MTTYSSLYISPIGKILITSTDKEIISIKPFNPSVDLIQFEPNQSQLIFECTKQLNQYFLGQRIQFELPYKLSGTSFQQKVWTILSQVKYGDTISYLQLAHLLGNKNYTRAVANANAKNKILFLIPCHRVIGNNASMVGYSFGGVKNKKWLLHLEQITSKKIVELF